MDDAEERADNLSDSSIDGNERLDSEPMEPKKRGTNEEEDTESDTDAPSKKDKTKQTLFSSGQFDELLDSQSEVASHAESDEQKQTIKRKR